MGVFRGACQTYEIGNWIDFLEKFGRKLVVNCLTYIFSLSRTTSPHILAPIRSPSSSEKKCLDLHEFFRRLPPLTSCLFTLAVGLVCAGQVKSARVPEWLVHRFVWAIAERQSSTNILTSENKSMRWKAPIELQNEALIHRGISSLLTSVVARKMLPDEALIFEEEEET